MTYGFTQLNNIERNSIAIRVFENHLIAINQYIENDPDFYDLTKVEYFYKGLKKVKDFDEKKTTRLIHNAWSTEFALNTARENVDPEYKKFALHWCFPQAYYSVFLLTTAFYEIKNTPVGRNHKGLINEFGQQILRGWYPRCMSFYCAGAYNNFTYHNGISYSPKNALSFSKNDPNSFSSQIAQLLKTTRIEKCQNRKDERQKSKTPFKTNTKIKTYLNQTEWNSLTTNLGPTTLLDFIYRLRIKANYEDINSFIESDYDVSNLIENLCSIISKINFVHEAYIAKLTGFDKFEAIYLCFPLKNGGHHLDERVNGRVKPLF